MPLDVTPVTSPLNPRPWLAVENDRLKRLNDALLSLVQITLK